MSNFETNPLNRWHWLRQAVEKAQQVPNNVNCIKDNNERDVELPPIIAFPVSGATIGGALGVRLTHEYQWKQFLNGLGRLDHEGRREFLGGSVGFIIGGLLGLAAGATAERHLNQTKE